MNVLQLAQLYSFQNDTKVQKLYYTDHPKAAEYAYKHNKLNPLVPDHTLKYGFSKESFRYFFSLNTSISYPIFEI